MTSVLPLTVAELIELLQGYPPYAVVVPEVTEDLIEELVQAVTVCGPPRDWDVPFDARLAPRLTVEDSHNGPIVTLTVEAP